MNIYCQYFYIAFFIALAQITMLQHVALPNVQDNSSLQAAMTRYKDLCQLVSDNFKVAPNVFGLVAHCILFSTDHWIPKDQEKLKDEKQIKSTFKLAESLLHLKLPTIVQLGSLLSSLKDISSLSSYFAIKLQRFTT